MRYFKLKKNISQLQSLTGLTKESFETLLFYFEQEWREYITHYTLGGRPRTRLSKGITCKHIPATADKLVFILSYLKNNPLQ